MGEKWRFGIEKGEAARFLSAYGLRLPDEKDSPGLGEMCFKDFLSSSGPRAAYERGALVNGTHCLVRAAKE